MLIPPLDQKIIILKDIWSILIEILYSSQLGTNVFVDRLYKSVGRSVFDFALLKLLDKLGVISKIKEW